MRNIYLCIYRGLASETQSIWLGLGAITTLGHIDFQLFRKRDFDGGGKSTFLFAKNDDGISLALKSTNVVHQRLIYYIHAYILKNSF